MAPLLTRLGNGGGSLGGFGFGGGGRRRAKSSYITASYSGTANVTESGNYRTIVWTGPGSFTIGAVEGVSGGPSDPLIDIAMMGGGAAGAERHAPGAPSGGMILAYDYNATPGTYPISIAAASPGNNNSTGFTAGNSGNGFGFTVVGGGSNQTSQPNPGNAANFNQYGPGTSAPGGDQGGGGAGTGGAGTSGTPSPSVGTGGPGREIPISPPFYGSGTGPTGSKLFGGGGAGAGRGPSAPGSPGGGGGTPNGNAVANTGSGGGGGTDSRTISGSGAAGICIVRYKYQ